MHRGGAPCRSPCIRWPVRFALPHVNVHPTAGAKKSRLQPATWVTRMGATPARCSSAVGAQYTDPRGAAGGGCEEGGVAAWQGRRGRSGGGLLGAAGRAVGAVSGRRGNGELATGAGSGGRADARSVGIRRIYAAKSDPALPVRPLGNVIPFCTSPGSVSPLSLSADMYTSHIGQVFTTAAPSVDTPPARRSWTEGGGGGRRRLVREVWAKEQV